MSRIVAWAGQLVAFIVVVAVTVLLVMPSSPSPAGAGDAVDLYDPEILHANGATLRWSRYTGPSGAPFDRYARSLPAITTPATIRPPRGSAPARPRSPAT